MNPWAAPVHRMRERDSLLDEPRLARNLRTSYAADPNPPEWVKEILSAIHRKRDGFIGDKQAHLSYV